MFAIASYVYVITRTHIWRLRKPSGRARGRFLNIWPSEECFSRATWKVEVLVIYSLRFVSRFALYMDWNFEREKERERERERRGMSGQRPLWYCAQITPNCSAHIRGHGNITSRTMYGPIRCGASVYSVLVAIRPRLYGNYTQSNACCIHINI